MTESEWLACTDPNAMLAFLRETSTATDRQARLFATACCRRTWQVLPDERSRRAVEVAEQYADRTLERLALAAAFHDAEQARDVFQQVVNRLEDEHSRLWRQGRHPSWPASELLVDGRLRASAVSCAATAAVWAVRAESLGGESAALVAAEIAAAFAVAAIQYMEWQQRASTHELNAEDWLAVEPSEKRQQAGLLRDILGNSLDSMTISPQLLKHQDGLLVKLAQSAYERRDFPSGQFDGERLAVLADALEDAGCDNADLVGHLRKQGAVHVRGCWVVDLLVGKG